MACPTLVGGRGYLIIRGDGDTQEGKGHSADIPAD